MKRLVAAASLSALALTAFAQTYDDQKVLVPASKDAIKKVYVSPGEFSRYQGAYDLSNGKVLYLTRTNTRMYARVDQQTAHEITRTARNKFASLDGTMSMHLVFADDDSVSGELSYIDEQQPAVAGVAPRVTIKLAAR